MKKLTIFFCFIIGIVFSLSANPGLENYFPEVNGFTKSTVKIIKPENFREYLKLKTDLFIDYGLKEIAVASYENKGQKIKVEIFQVSGSDFGFGLYSQDKSPEIQAFDKTGTQGYYQPGVMNFYKDSYYVKIRGENVEKDETVIKQLAKQIADKIPGETKLPAMLNTFPNFSKIIGFDRFVPKDFLGYPVFKNVFAADYNSANGPFTYFAFTSDSKEESKAILINYFKLIQVNPPKLSDGRFFVEDPIYGRIDFVIKGNLVKGIYGPVDSAARPEFFAFDYDEFIKKINIGGNIALNKKALSSSVESGYYQPANALDGDFSTRWASQFADSQWISIDLEKEFKINRVFLLWEGAYAEAYQIQASRDGQKWETVYETNKSDGNIDDITFSPVLARYVRLNAIKRHTAWGFSMYEFSVFKAE